MSVTAQAGTTSLPSPPVLSGTVAFGPLALLYGVRLWVAVCLALFIAFRLELQNPSWAGTTAAIVCQPEVGAALRRGWFRMIGTVGGAIAIAAITIAFPQSRSGFFITLALWGAGSAMLATLLHNFASYAGALAGFTAFIVAADMLGATGGTSDVVFQLGITRTTEILIGIVCATSVLAASDFGSARRRLGESLGRLSGQAAAGLCRALHPDVDAEAERQQRRLLLSQVSGLSVIVAQAAGEISALPFRPRVLQYGIDGLFAAITAWRAVMTHRESHPTTTEADAARVLGYLPERLIRETEQPSLHTDLAALRGDCLALVRRLLTMPADTPSQRLLADSMARGLLAVRQTLGALALLRRSHGFVPRPRRVRMIVPDYLPPLLNGIRAFLTIGVADLIWIVTAWPNGGTMIVFTAITVILMAPLDEAAYGAAWSFLLGAVAAAVLAAILAFAVLPMRIGFISFCAVLGFVLIPAGALAAQSWRQPVFVAMAANFIPLLRPSNPEVYDVTAFYNNALALVSGVAVTVIALRLMPPLSPAFRARRLLMLTLRDLRRLTCGPRPAPASVWQRHAYARMGALTAQMDLLQHARMAAALAVGDTIIRLRHLTDRLTMQLDMAPVLQALLRGDSGGAIDALVRLDAVLEALFRGSVGWHAGQALRARANVAELIEALRRHSTYFDANPSG